MYDLIGDIAILDSKADKKMAVALLKMKNIRTVMQRRQKHVGRYRTQKLVHVAGERKTMTTAKENRVVLAVDVASAYYSPRLGSERMRLAKLVKKGERVLVMFSGIAPYPLVISRHSPAVEIVGVEWNPSAHDLGVKNVLLNRMAQKIKLVLGNVKNVKCGKFDRVIMMHPAGADRYLRYGLRALKKGGMLHVYAFAKSKRKEISLMKKLGRGTIVRTVKTAQVAPGMYRMCYDIKV